jgi:hypothetical protein
VWHRCGIETHGNGNSLSLASHFIRVAIHPTVVDIATATANTASSSAVAASRRKLQRGGHGAGILCAGRKSDLAMIGHVVWVGEDSTVSPSAAAVGVVLVGTAVRVHDESFLYEVDVNSRMGVERPGQESEDTEVSWACLGAKEWEFKYQCVSDLREAGAG